MRYLKGPMLETDNSLEPAGVRMTRRSKRISVSALLGCESAYYGAPREIGGGPLTENPPVSFINRGSLLKIIRKSGRRKGPPGQDVSKKPP